MAYTAYFQYTTGSTIYAKARPLNATWATGIVSLSENSSTGDYSGTLDADTDYVVYSQAGGSPASSDVAIGEIGRLPAAGSVDGYTLRQVLGFMASVLVGKVTGAGTGTQTFRSVDDTANRIVATVDSAGNRSALTLTEDAITE